MDIDLQEISSLIKNKLEFYSFDKGVKISEEGIVLESADGIARIGGLPNAMLSEMIEFPNKKYGIVFNLEFDEVVVIILGKHTDVREGAWARCTNKIMQVPVGKNLLGRVINATGEAIDGLGPITTDKFRPIENVVPGVIDRSPVDTPLQTGYKIIDALVPIGRGQRELIVGDRQTGKTTLAIDAIINQKDTGVISIYVAIGQKSSSIVDAVNILKNAGAFKNTIVIDASANDPAAMQYLAPFSGIAIAEEFMYTHHQDVLIVYDDLTKHANAYRTLSLLLQRPPGREAYPGDIFYLHSRLLERSAKLSKELGGGSITALPIIETQKGDISTYIPTNVISITDGQIFLETALFYSGVRPAINAGISVSRVGG
ncbi:MAG: F0F1 ATP synthase subunit alpha, partial [Candidatus Margulisiibacteriota bacterium]